MSQNPMKFDQQVPRDMWGKHAKGFCMKSTFNIEYIGLKLELLIEIWKKKEKSLGKNDEGSHTSACRRLSWEKSG